MRRVVAVLAAVLLVASCSSKSSEEKAAEEVAEAAIEAMIDHDFEKILESLSGDEVGEAKEAVLVSEETARAWPDKFCSLEIGMTRDEVQAIMGTPTSTFRNRSFNLDSYDGWGWMLNIFYDVDDRAEQLQSYPSASGKVPCESVRFPE
jgi:hypothetical protein